MTETIAGLEKLIGEHEKAVELSHASFTAAVEKILEAVERQKYELNRSQMRINTLEKELAAARVEKRGLLQEGGSANAALLRELNRLRLKCGEQQISEEELMELASKASDEDCEATQKEEVPEISVEKPVARHAQLRTSLRLSSARPLLLGSYEPNLELPGILKEQVERVKSMKVTKANDSVLDAGLNEEVDPPFEGTTITSEEEEVDQLPEDESIASASLVEALVVKDISVGELKPSKGRVRTLSSHRLAAIANEKNVLSPEAEVKLHELKEQEKDFDEDTKTERMAAAAVISSHFHRAALRTRLRRAVDSIHATPEAAAGRLRNEVMREFVNSEASYSYFLEMVVTVCSSSLFALASR